VIFTEVGKNSHVNMESIIIGNEVVVFMALPCAYHR